MKIKKLTKHLRWWAHKHQHYFLVRGIGIALLAITIMLILIASKGSNPVENDATGVLITAPLAIFFLFGKVEE